MTKKLIMVMAMMLLAVCLLSGGCSRVDDSKINSWKDLIKIPSASDKSTPNDKDTPTPGNESPEIGEQISVKLYFINAETNKLAVEKRSIGKVEGIARQTMEELIKGPSQQEYQPVLPVDTRLLDINIKPDGLCIVDLSGEADKVSSKEQGKLMVQAVANTLSQFPSVKEVSFLINGERVEALGGLVDIAQPVQADYGY